MRPTHAHAFQATDLARRAREVVDKARQGSVLVRDKDGTLLSFGLAADVERSSLLVKALTDLVRLETVVRTPHTQRRTAAFGDLAWASSLSEEDLDDFVAELEETLLRSVADGDMERIEDLLYDWKATAAVAADDELALELKGDLTEPLDESL